MTVCECVCLRKKYFFFFIFFFSPIKHISIAHTKTKMHLPIPN